MDINKNQQINTFTKGMNTDASDAYIPSEQYRYAENLRVTSDENCTAGELHLIEGTKKTTPTAIPEYEIKENIAIDATVEYDGEETIDDTYRTWKIDLKSIDVYDTNRSTNDSVHIIFFKKYNDDLYLLGPNDTAEKLTIPYKTKVQDWTESNLAWGTLRNKQRLWGPVDYVTDQQNATHTGHVDTVLEEPSPGFVRIVSDQYEQSEQAPDIEFYLFYINDTQQYVSPVLKVTVIESEVNVGGSAPDVTKHGGISEFQLCGEGLLYDILDVNYIKNICTIISADSSADTWKISLYDYDTKNLYSITDSFTEKIWEDGQDFNKKFLSTSLIWEADDNIKLYIADGIHKLMCVRIQKTKTGFKKVKGDFKTVFGESTQLLPAPQVDVSESPGHINGKKVQYAYVLYEKYGVSFGLSPLSNQLSLYKDNVSGFYDTESSRSVNITIPEMSLSQGTYIRMYRIAYNLAGQPPTVSVVVDRQVEGAVSYIDNGYDISHESISDFIANVDLGLRPKLIEQKNNYLFAANVKYSQDETNDVFKDFDPRCFSLGDYIVDEGSRIRFDGTNVDLFLSHNINDVKNLQFDNYSIYSHNDDFWGNIGTSGYNGIGKYFKWKYSVDNTHELSPTGQYLDDKTSHNTYRRNEVYRFGVRLYDHNGNASSVKWIADIKMPDFYDYKRNDSEYNKVHTLLSLGAHSERGIFAIPNILNIEFAPTNTNDPIWQNIAAYEILQSPRTREDTYGLTQGIGGYPIFAHGDYGRLCVPYYMTTDRFSVMVSGQGKTFPSQTISSSYYLGWAFSQHVDHLLFSSPEVVYTQDDIDSILKSRNNNWFIKNIYTYNYEGNEKSFEANENPKLYMFLPYVIKHFGTDTFNADQIYWNDGRWGGADQNSVISNDTSFSLVTSKYSDFAIGIVKDAESAREEGDISGSSYVVDFENRGGYYLDDTIMWRCNATNAPKAGYKSWMSYMLPSEISQPDEEASVSGIRGHIAVKSENPDNFSDGSNVTIKNNPYTIGQFTYYNWTNPQFINYYQDPEIAEFVPKLLWNENGWGEQDWDVPKSRHYGQEIENFNSVIKMPISAGGRYILLKTDGEFVPRNPIGKFLGGVDAHVEGMPSSQVFQIYQTGIRPYGGRDKSSILGSTYISIGCFTICNSTPQSCIAKGGDGFIKYFTFNHLSTEYNAALWNTNSLRVLYRVPLESTVDVQGQASEYLYNEDHRVRDIAGVTNGFAMKTGLYVYNTSYNMMPDVITYYPNDEEGKESQYTTRVHYSLPKTNNEAMDSWTKFKMADFIDVDTRYGDITDIKLFRDKLVFMQDKAAGVLSVNDRTIINDADGNNIILGNGGVLQRYDYITTIYGMKPDQKAHAASNNALYWWDGYNKEIIQYQDGYTINQLQHQKQIDSYIQHRNESTIPSVFYDRRNKEVVFNVVNDESVVYNEKIDAFSSVYTFCPVYHCDLINNQLVIDKMNSLYEYNTCEEEGKSMLFGVAATPKLQYVINSDSVYNKTFDIQTFGGRFYGGSDIYEQDELPYHIKGEHNNDPLSVLSFKYNTPLKQESKTTGKSVTNYEYEYRLTIPRNGEGNGEFDSKMQWGNRMRGKTMQCELKSSSNDLDFSLQYIITKYRMSWT